MFNFPSPSPSKIVEFKKQKALLDIFIQFDFDITIVQQGYLGAKTISVGIIVLHLYIMCQPLLCQISEYIL